MTPPPASVVIVSRGRPQDLDRCLKALLWQDHPAFEVVVVADPAGIAAAAASGVPHRAVPFDEANISRARNLGIGAAAGAQIAFLDDDAVAEPTWLSRLLAPLGAGVVATTGRVLGSNGISLQWGQVWIDRAGRDHAVAHGSGAFVKLLGTNMAFDAGALRAAGGFDPLLRFYLDDGDISLRIAASGAVQHVPGAVVLHGFAPSAQRRADRLPLSLADIGRSSAVFLRRHSEGGAEARLAEILAEQEARLARHVKAGRIDGAGAKALISGLISGWDEGMTLPLAPLSPLPAGGVRPLLLPGTGPRSGLVLAGRRWSRRRLLAAAGAAVGRGLVTTILCLSPGIAPHRHRFDPGGFWVQEGGIFGWSDRKGARIILKGFRARLRAETARLAETRPVSGGEIK